MGVAPSTVTRVYIFRYVFLTYIYLYRKIEFQHHLKTSPLSQESLRLHCPTKITCFYKNSSEKVRWNLRTRTNFLRKMEKIWTDFFQPFVFRRLGCLVFQLNRFNTQILRNPGRPTMPKLRQKKSTDSHPWPCDAQAMRLVTDANCIHAAQIKECLWTSVCPWCDVYHIIY